MTKYGYARVSTAAQSAQAQVEALRRWGVEEAFIECETVSGAKARREGLDRILSEVQAGDEVYVTKLDRLGRNMRELHKIGSLLEARGVVLVIGGQAHDPSTPTGRLLFNVLAMVAEFERDMTAERTADRLASMKAAGESVGRPRVTTPEQERVIRELFAAGFSFSEVGGVTKLSNGTLSRIKNEGDDLAVIKADPTIMKQARSILVDRERQLAKAGKFFTNRR